MKLKRKEFLAELAKLADGLRRTIEAECEGFSPDPKASAGRRARALGDFAFFRRTYFPHYVKHGDSILHTWLDGALPALVDHPDGQRLAVAAPRGEAKSTVVSLMFVLWCVVTGRKRYVPLIADAFEQAAATLLEPIKAELEANPRLAMDFPEACGTGRLWNAGVVITAGDAKLQAFGSGKRMRGLRHGPHRPDLVICDDLENDENVRSPDQRDKLQAWLTKTVLSLGEAGDTMDVILVGTILHYDSVLARLLENPLWRSRKFRAVLAWPERMDLWDRWEEILLARGQAGGQEGGESDGGETGGHKAGGEDAARAFYEENAQAMQAGAHVSWPSARPLYKLMLKRARDGHAAFDSEQQNDPLQGEGAPFANCIAFWVARPDDWRFFGAVDPSLGKAGASRDPSAILVGGYTRQLCAPLAYVNDGVTDATLMPVFAFDCNRPEDLAKLAGALPKLVDVMDIPARWAHERAGIPQPEDGEPVLARKNKAATPVEKAGPDARPGQPAKAAATAALTADAPNADPLAGLYPDQDAVDAAAVPDATLTALARDLLAPILAEAQAGTSPEALLGKLAELFPRMDATGLEELCARALFVGELWGRLSARDEGEST